MEQRNTAREQGAFYLMLVVVAFSVWLELLVLGRRYVALILVFGWFSPYVWFGWLGSLLLALGRFRRRHTGQVPCLELLLPLLMMGSCAWQTLTFQRLQSYPAFDEFLFAFDGNYGYIAFRLGEWCLRCAPIVQAFIKWVYLGSLLPLVFVYLSLGPDIKIRRRLWVSFALMGMSGVIFYQICPAAGPVYIFPESYPLHIPLIHRPQPRILPHAILNAIPSLHLALALLTLLYARYCARRILIGAVIYVFLIALATLALGEHYFIDLIVAVPFIVGVDKLHELVRNRNERVTVYACFSVVLAWEIALRQGSALKLSTPMVWLLSIGTILIPIVPIPSLVITARGMRLELPTPSGIPT